MTDSQRLSACTEAAAEALGVTAADVLHPARARRQADARRFVAALAIRELRVPMPEVARYLSVHRTTPYHAVRRHVEIASVDAGYAAEYARARAVLSGLVPSFQTAPAGSDAASAGDR